MNTQRPLPNPFGPDKKIPFPARAPQKIVAPDSGVMSPPATLQPSKSLPTTLPPLPVQAPQKVQEQVHYEDTVEYETTPALEIEEDGDYEEYDDEEEFEEYDEEDEEDYEEVTAEEDDFLARIFASTSPNVAQQTLFALSRDRNWQVRNSVAMNLEAPATVLNLLATDIEDLVRQTVMENLNTSDETYVEFVNDECDDIQIAFIRNARTTAEMLEPILNTDNEFVAEALMESPLVSSVVKTRLHSQFD